MVNVVGFLNNGLNFINLAGGLQTSVTKYNYYVSGSDYDDALTKTITGSVSFSGLVFPVHSKQGSNEALLLEQGKLTTQDSILYCGSIQLNTSGNTFQIGSKYFSMIENGIIQYTVAGTQIYNKIYLRNQPGSVW